MKKNLILIAIVMIINILSAEVCWNNGVPVYEGNFIYQQHSTITADGNIFISWSEKNEGLRKLKLQKTDSSGVPIWEEPKTIDQNQYELFEEKIISSQDGGCFIDAYNTNSIQKFYKIDENGNVVWDQIFTEFRGFTNYLELPDGKISLTYQTHNSEMYQIKNTIFDSEGNLVNNNIEFYEAVSNDLKIVDQQFQDEYLYSLINIQNECFILKTDSDGQVVNQTEPYSVGSYFISKFHDNSYFLLSLNQDTHILEMLNFDLEGTSLLQESPKVIAENVNYLSNDFAFGEDYFYAIFSIMTDSYHVDRFDLNGDLLVSNLVAPENCFNINVYDQDVDFISLVTYDSNLDLTEAFLIAMDENGLAEPISYLTDIFSEWWCEKYFVDDGFSIVRYKGLNDKMICTMRNIGDESEVHLIRDIVNEIIDPELIVRDGNIASVWISVENNGLMIQEFADDGTIQYQPNGELLIENIKNYKIIDEKIYKYEFPYMNTTGLLACYDFFGNQLWEEQIDMESDQQFKTKVFPFYDENIIIARRYENPEVIKYLAFDENGILWDEIKTFEDDAFDYFAHVTVKGNNLFFENSNQIYCYSLDEEGNFSDQQVLAQNSDGVYFYGTESDFFVVTCEGYTSARDLHYFHDGESMWEEPWHLSSGIHNNLNVFFEEDGFYFTGSDYPNSLKFDKYNYDHNLIQESSFELEIECQNIVGIKMRKKDDQFVISLNTNSYTNGRQLKYFIVNTNGEIIEPTDSNNIVDREYLEYIFNDIMYDDNVYLLISCYFSPWFGTAERDFYLQKIDVSNWVENHDDVVSEPQTILKNYPNPFNPTTTISFEIPKNYKNANLEIFNIKGQKIKNYIIENNVVLSPSTSLRTGLTEGSIIWNGTDSADKKVSSGIYFYKLIVDGKYESSNKCILLK